MVAKAAGFALSNTVLLPVDKKLKVPGIGPSFSVHAPQWGRNHKIAYNAARVMSTALLALPTLVVRIL